MILPFDPAARFLTIPVRVLGPRRDYNFKCRLDTGSTETVLSATILRLMGFDLSRPVGRTRIRSATGVAFAPLLRVSAVAALGQVRTSFVVAAHDLPLGTEADGLLGLDFFRGLVLTIDFRRGRISLSRKRWWQFWR